MTTIRTTSRPRRDTPTRVKRAPPRRKQQAAGDRPISVVPAPAGDGIRSGVTPRASFLALVLLLAVAGLVGLVLLNTAVNENAFRLHDLETKQDALDKEEQRLQSDLSRVESPAELERRAKQLKLVPAGDPAFVVLPDGRVEGTPTPARAPTTAPPATGKPKPSAKVTPARSTGANTSFLPAICGDLICASGVSISISTSGRSRVTS